MIADVLYLSENIRTAMLYSEPHKALDVKFSTTASAWIKFHTTYATNQRTCLISYRYVSGTGK